MYKFKQFFYNVFFVIGVISSVVGIILAYISTESAELLKTPIFPVVIALIAIGYGLYSIRKKFNIELKISERVKLRVFFDDIFERDGIIVIPVNDYFDTLVDDNVVSKRTLHGTFIKSIFGGNEAELKKLIRNGLSGVDPIEVNDDRKIKNSNKRYPLGTVCEIRYDGKVFYLFALTRFNENNRAEVTSVEYQNALSNLFSFIEQKSQGMAVNIPLIGAGHSGVKLSKQKLLEFLIFSISLNNNLTLVNGINIVLRDSVKNEIDLSMTEFLFKKIGS
jgi:hypothetical protein